MRIAVLIPLIITLLTPLFVASGQQPSVQRRFSESSFSRSLLIDTGAPQLVRSVGTVSENFEYEGQWKLQVTSDGSFDTNAFQDFTSLDDWRWNYGTSLGYEWWVSDETGLVITPRIGAIGQRYDTHVALDGDLLTTGISFTFKKLPLEPTVNYGAAWGFTPGYDSHNYTEQALNLEFGHQYFLRKTADGKEDETGPSLTWKAAAGYIIVEPDNLTARAAGLGLEGKVPLSEKLTLNLATGVGYRDFPESSALGRDTLTASIGASFDWLLSKQAGREWTLVTGVNYIHAADSLPGLDYDQVSAFVSLRFAWSGFRFVGLPPAGHETSAQHSPSK